MWAHESPEIQSNKVVKTVNTNLGIFGNRTDIIIVDDGTVRGLSLLECDNPNVTYHHNADPVDLFDL